MSITTKTTPWTTQTIARTARISPALVTSPLRESAVSSQANSRFSKLVSARPHPLMYVFLDFPIRPNYFSVFSFLAGPNFSWLFVAYQFLCCQCLYKTFENCCKKSDCKSLINSRSLRNHSPWINPSSLPSYSFSFSLIFTSAGPERPRGWISPSPSHPETFLTAHWGAPAHHRYRRSNPRKAGARTENSYRKISSKYMFP